MQNTRGFYERTRATRTGKSPTFFCISAGAAVGRGDSRETVGPAEGAGTGGVGRGGGSAGCGDGGGGGGRRRAVALVGRTRRGDTV